ncbi:MAG: Asp-tRNA(Asn)/Glu-tRNA(Gln) amidotransferase subunit GatB [Erysipelotrichaceae bacterium]|jgi:aspartyl-tRNA(Asn)/glutamyl-tRNA(Gln) amidotransferase subunit B|nr:Asp-tRNA(Asn)/Glu-tRNA(Gln) amidotransferase subunit GatB [Erysipelotrichaceae bacterium]
MNFEVIIGIEIHCELKTTTKMFSGAPVTFGQAPNSAVNEIDLAHPGTLPCVNKEAVRKALLACYACHCEIDTLVRFDRKNYYYSDLPKGYQITQQFHPIGSHGYITLSTGKKVRLNRIHMEEDTAKQFHLSDKTEMDFNRAGVPLVEIVSEPDLRSSAEAIDYVNQLREILEYLDVSDAKMEEGSIRCDINISLRPYGYDGFGTKVEIKNLNSLANIERAIEFESERQSELYLRGKSVIQETRRFDEASRTTKSMRTKETALDYKYFPEPNIFPIRLSEKWLKEIQDNMPESAKAKRERFVGLGLSETDAAILVSQRPLAAFFEETIQYTDQIKAVANWLLVDTLGYCNKENLPVADLKLKPKALADLIDLIQNKTISSKQAKEVFAQLLEGRDAGEVVKSKGMTQVSDAGFIQSLIDEVLAENPQLIADYRAGKDRSLGFVVGQVMKKSQGKANPALTSDLAKKALSGQ